jgi:TolB protein
MRIISVLVSLIIIASMKPLSSSTTTEAKRITTHKANDYHPRWAPSGKSLLFTSQRNGRIGIWKISWPPGTLEELKMDLIGDYHISWAPDGSQIAFDANPGSGPSAIWITRVDDVKPRQLKAAGRPSFHPSWSPDGQDIAFASYRSGNCDIWKVSLKRDEAVQLTQSDATDYHPVWSPDGKEILFASDRDGDFDIWSISVKCGMPVCLWDNQGRFDHPCYSPDGKWIVFAEIDSMESVLWLASRETKERTTLIRGPGVSWPSWSPDGKIVAYAAKGDTGLDIWVITVPRIVEDPNNSK